MSNCMHSWVSAAGLDLIIHAFCSQCAAVAITLRDESVTPTAYTVKIVEPS